VGAGPPCPSSVVVFLSQAVQPLRPAGVGGLSSRSAGQNGGLRLGPAHHSPCQPRYEDRVSLQPLPSSWHKIGTFGNTAHRVTPQSTRSALWASIDLAGYSLFGIGEDDPKRGALAAKYPTPILMADRDRRDGVRQALGAVHAALNRPRLWRVTAALAALLLCALLLVCSQGSLTIIAQKPTADGQGAAALPGADGPGAARSQGAAALSAALPSWEPWCTRGTPRKERERLAFCARVEGRVLTSTHGPQPDETHIAVISDFHIVLVRLPNWEATPKRGAKIVAIGPLFRARDGQREVQAFRYETT
jgi:hypothetical protein